MYQAIRQKLNRSTGASMLLALLFFLACMTVGAVVLTAAATNTGRIARNRQAQQTYLAAASAARLIAEDLDGQSFTGTYRKIVTETEIPPQKAPDGSVTPGYLQTDTRFLADPPSLQNGRLLLPAESDLSALYRSALPPETGLTLPPPTDISLPLRVTVPAESGTFPPVEGTLSIQTGSGSAPLYTATAVIFALLEDGSRSDAMTITLTAQIHSDAVTQRSVSENVTVTTTTYTTAVTWSDPVIVKGGS